MITESQINEAVSALFSQIEFTAEPAGLYDPLRYMIAIGGKRIRPKLCYTAYSLFKDSIGPEIAEPATALEVFHTFTLIHDDIMDKSPLRRGHETVWKKWSDDTAVLSGDVMLIDSYRRLEAVPAPVLGLFSRTAAQVCEGQQYDMEFERRDDVSLAEYENMIRLKTAVLIACSAEFGARIAAADEASCRALYEYGLMLGMAFQIADDYLDAFGDQKLFGKPIGGDIVNGKKSWLTVHAVEKLKSQEKINGVSLKEFTSAFDLPADSDSEKSEKIALVKSLYSAVGVEEDAKNEILRYNGLAMAAVDNLGLSEEGRNRLLSFARQLVGRAY